MRIAVVHSFYSSSVPSGENRVVQDEVEALLRAGHDVTLHAAATDDLKEHAGFRIRSAARVSTGWGRQPLFDESHPPDIIQVHNLFPNFGTRWTSHAPAPIVATLHNYRWTCANGVALRDGAVCTLCFGGNSTHALRYRCYRGSTIATAAVAFSHFGPIDRQPLLRNARRVRVLSPQMAAALTERGFPSDRIDRWRNFLPDSLRPQRVDSGRQGFVFVGRLSPEKGIDRLLGEWPRNLQLTVVGDGPLRDECHRLAVGKRVEFVGSASRRDAIRIMQRHTWLVFPSVVFEAAPLVYLEALASGLLIAACQPSSPAQTVAEDGTGVAFPNPEALGQGAANLASSSFADPIRVFEERYSEAAFIRQTEASYEQVRSRQG